MRVIDHRYRSELIQHNLALRLVSHNAHTRTICNWTGLSVDRVRKLFRTYAPAPTERRDGRLRGSAPYQVAFFTRSPRIRTEAAILAGYLQLNGALAEQETMSRAERLCEAFETYASVIRGSVIPFGYAILLLNALRSGDQIYIRECVTCDTLVAVDRIRCPRARCVWCG